MSSSFIEDLRALISAATGRPARDDLRTHVVSLLAPGFGSEIGLPTYFTAGIRGLVVGEFVDWTDVSPDERGLSWVMRDLVPVVPGVVWHEQPGQHAWAVPAVRRVLLVDFSRTQERWALLSNLPPCVEPAS
jgi:hypothetical protein